MKVVSEAIAANSRARHLRCKENHRHRHGYVDNSLARVLAHTHSATTTDSSLQNRLVDPKADIRGTADSTCVSAVCPSGFREHQE